MLDGGRGNASFAERFDLLSFFLPRYRGAHTHAGISTDKRRQVVPIGLSLEQLVLQVRARIIAAADAVITNNYAEQRTQS